MYRSPAGTRFLAGLFLVYTFILELGAWRGYTDIQNLNNCPGAQIGIYRGEHDVGNTENEVFRTQESSSGSGMVRGGA
jgi:hypothetical protein